MTILFTMTGSWGTGSGTVVEATVGHLAARGHRVCVLYPETAGAPSLQNAHAPEAQHEIWPFPLRQGEVELYTFPLMIADPNPTNFDGAWTFRDLSQAQLDLYVSSFQERLREVIADVRPDVIECQHIWAMPYAVADLGIPFTVMAHHSDQMGFDFDERIQPYATKAAEAAAFIFALNDANRAEIVELYGVPDEKIVVLGNGYDKEVFHPGEVGRAALLARFELDIPDDAPLVTFAGKLSKTKGVDILLLANGLVQASRAEAGMPPVHLIMFGTGRLDDVLDDGEPGYSTEHVHFIGHQPYEAVRDFHNLARCSVMPSRTEGFGLAALEAMGCGLPLVVTAIGAADDYAVGEIVPPEDAGALAEAILKLVELPRAEWEALSAAALARAQTFSWEAITEKRLDHYARVPAGSRLYHPLTVIHVRPITAAETRPLRSAVLRPGQPASSLVYPGDDAPGSFHAGAVVNGEIVGIATVYPEPMPLAAETELDPANAFRLRGMATRPDLQGTGVGRAVLARCIEHAAEARADLLWCNARVSALGFYRRLGFETVGDTFEIAGIGPHVVMWTRVSSRHSVT